MKFQSVQLLGVPVHATTLALAADHVARSAAESRGGWVVTPNLDILRRTTKDPEFRNLYDETTLRLADGITLVWASRLKRTPLPERAAGSDLIYVLMAAAAEHGASVYFLGGNPGAAEKSAEVFRAKHPGVKIVGIACPPWGFDKDPVQMKSLADHILAAKPNIVLVALGSPKQEKLIRFLRKDLPDVWFAGIGITFSFVAGEVPRAPVWMQRSGLEWIHRLWQEPRRLFKRYIIDGIPFGMYLLTVSAWQGLWRGGSSDAAVSVPVASERRSS